MRDADARLVGPAVVVWAVTALCLSCSPAGAMTVAVIAAVGGVVMAGLWWSGTLRWDLVGPVVICAGLAVSAATAIALRLEVSDRHPVTDVHGKTTMVITLREDPTAFGPAAAGRIRARVEIETLARRPVRRASAELTGRTEDWVGLVPGQRLQVVVSVRPPRPATLSVARLDAVGAPHLLGRPPPLQRAASHIRNRLQQSASRALAPDASGLFPGLVLGDESAVSEDLREDFRAAGLLHLTAVSGANFSLVVGVVIVAVRLAGGSPRVVAVAGAVTILGFVILVRPSPSVLRAAIMGAVGLLAVLSARRAQALPALGAAVIGAVLWWPELSREPGFVLSVVATAGLVVLAPGLRDGLRRIRVPAGVAELAAMAIAAQLVSAPMIAYLTGTVSVVSVVANVAVAPVVAVIGLVGTSAAVVGAFGVDDGLPIMFSEFLIRTMAPEMWWLIGCARHLGGLRWAVFEVPDGAMGALWVGVATVVAAVLIRFGAPHGVAVGRGALARCRRGLARWAP
ncbi:ComEC/Rec2 family competence protein [Gordonia sp. NPDC003504]